jgi:hypothetical protein
MSQSEACPDGAGRRYNWCPGCGELWLVAWMKTARVDLCPSCERRVLPYIGRSPHDTGRACPDGPPVRMRPRREPGRADQHRFAGLPRAAIPGRS